ncbi:ketopantoate reductase family protein [Streptomyces jeddahensis]|uniref:2-dehydropantoate 2-reductase n=1 Tax=Streptomyces jeddahensis TaxID=1716141 RepID=A0A177HUB8_9ACTN|nr:2-dehydropantoate 2-reductase [Streptomyces jeddahensis]OAH14495.1 2-dehydropantoate 2-reductase [Streptomyces jeddahensis]
MSTSRLTVAVLGPGGVGGLIGALLARAGHRVLCLAGQDTADALRRDGLTVRSGRYGQFTLPVEADTVLREPVDACLITVKATALAPALDRVDRDALGSGLVVPLLNGIEHLDLLRERYPAEQVAAATIRVEATRVAPGQIEHTSPFAAVELAGHTALRDRLDGFAEHLRGAGLDVTLRDDETAMLWDKLVFLAPFALLTTRHRTDIGGVRTEQRQELLTVIREITAVARATGAPADADAVLAFFDRAPATMKSSMQRDAEAGRSIELDAIAGAVLRTAEAHDLATPATARLVAELAGG